MSHLYRDTVDEKEKKRKKGSIMIGKKKRPIEGAETNVRFLDHKRIPFVCINFGLDVLMYVTSRVER